MHHSSHGALMGFQNRNIAIYLFGIFIRRGRNNLHMQRSVASVVPLSKHSELVQLLFAIPLALALTRVWNGMPTSKSGRVGARASERHSHFENKLKNERKQRHTDGRVAAADSANVSQSKSTGIERGPSRRCLLFHPYSCPFSLLHLPSNVSSLLVLLTKRGRRSRASAPRNRYR